MCIRDRDTITKTVDTVKAITPTPIEKKPEIANNRTTIKDTIAKTVDTVKAITSTPIEKKPEIANNTITPIKDTIAKTVDTAVKVITPAPIDKKPEIVNNRTTIKDTISKTVDTVKATPVIIPPPTEEIKKAIVKTIDTTALKPAAAIKLGSADSITKPSVIPVTNKDTTTPIAVSYTHLTLPTKRIV